jgi:hypothetical protein
MPLKERMSPTRMLQVDAIPIPSSPHTSSSSSSSVKKLRSDQQQVLYIYNASGDEDSDERVAFADNPSGYPKRLVFCLCFLQILLAFAVIVDQVNLITLLL